MDKQLSFIPTYSQLETRLAELEARAKELEPVLWKIHEIAANHSLDWAEPLAEKIEALAKEALGEGK